MAEPKTYRHKHTGLVSKLSEGMAKVFAAVVDEVSPDAKPLAYTPASDEAVAEAKHLAANAVPDSVIDTAAPTHVADPESSVTP